jgi:hypothetical protein
VKGLVHGPIIREGLQKPWVDNDDIRRRGDALGVLAAYQVPKIRALVLSSELVGAWRLTLFMDLPFGRSHWPGASVHRLLSGKAGDIRLQENQVRRAIALL